MHLPTFSDLDLIPPLLEGINRLGFERPSPIQAQTIPPALKGQDIIGLSQTGSGKTAAFALPALQKIALEKKQPQVLILCPTRELSVQVCEEIHQLGFHLQGFHATPIYGGAGMDRQIRALRQGTHLVVGTPGRILDHLKRGTFQTEHIHTIILDEADRMLDMGFRDDMETLLSSVPKERQTLFFSATMNPGVERLIQHFGSNPKMISIERKTLTVASIEQTYYEVRNRSKIEVLSRLIDIDPPRLAIVFCNTKRMVDDCCEALLARGYAADRLHGDISQQNRERVLNRFREGAIELLVATDVAARGLDIDHVDLIFNYDLPYDPEDYVHRIGRTGRAGRSGRATSFVFGREIYRLQSIERYTQQTIRRVKIPTQEDVEGRRVHTIFHALRERLETQKFTPHEAFIDQLLDRGHTPTDIASALFTLLREAQGRELESIIEDNPSSRSDSKNKRSRRDQRPRPARQRKNKKRPHHSDKNLSKKSGKKRRR